MPERALIFRKILLCLNHVVASSKFSVKKINAKRGKAIYLGSPFFWLLFFGEAKKSNSPHQAKPMNPTKI
ncbi:hypothetical protein FXB74_08090 [Aggregatibacter actinomycetemcomitans]|nr:hypothetical protein FXB74_08090 [Aggregatibacter actinomycetemcomitans]